MFSDSMSNTVNAVKTLFWPENISLQFSHPYKTEAVYYFMWTDGYDFIRKKTYLGRCFIDDKKYKTPALINGFAESYWLPLSELLFLCLLRLDT